MFLLELKAMAALSNCKARARLNLTLTA